LIVLDRSVSYAFALATVVISAAGPAHRFLPGGGVNTIESMIVESGTPDPAPYHIFALRSLAQPARADIYFAAAAPGETGNYVFIPLASIMIIRAPAGVKS
jgi:hypothetical protein